MLACQPQCCHHSPLQCINQDHKCSQSHQQWHQDHQTPSRLSLDFPARSSWSGHKTSESHGDSDQSGFWQCYTCHRQPPCWFDCSWSGEVVELQQMSRHQSEEQDRLSVLVDCLGQGWQTRCHWQLEGICLAKHTLHRMLWKNPLWTPKMLDFLILTVGVVTVLDYQVEQSLDLAQGTRQLWIGRSHPWSGFRGSQFVGQSQLGRQHFEHRTSQRAFHPQCWRCHCQGRQARSWSS